MVMENRSEIIKEELSYINELALFADGFDDALIGIDQVDYVAVYDSDKCIDILMEDSDMTIQEATEYFEFNVLGSYVGEYTPRFIKLYD
jgi:hypothetical protein